jgi:hypothetical protein
VLGPYTRSRERVLARTFEREKENSMAYNGWSNYETWNVALWIGNEPYTYQESIDMAQRAYDDADGDEDEAKSKLAAELKDWIEDMNPLASDASMFSDLLGAALGEVDWYEFAENLLSDVEKKEPEEEEEAEPVETE